MNCSIVDGKSGFSFVINNALKKLHLILLLSILITIIAANNNLLPLV